MDDDRLILHERLSIVFPNHKLYFRPPSNLILEYPCIVYDHVGVPTRYANDTPYSIGSEFQFTIITSLPGERNPKLGILVKGSRFVRSFTTSDLVHDIFNVLINKA